MNSIIPTHVEDGKILVTAPNGQVRFIVKDGVYYNPSINEYEVWFDDEPAFYASTEAIANGLYREALRLRKDHYEAGNDDIPFLGEPLPYDDDHQPAGSNTGWPAMARGAGSNV